MGKGQKMSMAEFLGNNASGSGPVDPLPSGPRARAEGDDGAFRRAPRRSDMDDREVSRSDGDSSWRRGGGGGAGGGGFDSRSNDRGGGGGYNNTRDGDSGWRRGGGGGGGTSSGFDSRGADGESSWRRGGSSGGGGMGRLGSNGSAASGGGGERPRLNLSRRTKEDDENKGSSTATSNQPKSNPFGSATAVDTASRFAKIDLRENEQKEQKKEQAEQETADAKDEEKPAKEEKIEADVAEKAGAENNTQSEENIDATNNDEEPSAKEGETKDEENKSGEKKRERRERKVRQPKVVNSRAAMLDATDAPKKVELGEPRDRRNRGGRDRRDRDNMGPPPVVNERFAKLAEEEKEKNLEREFRRRDDNRGPPVAQNSRFAAAAEADRSVPRDNDVDEGPPVPQNSRFAAAAADYEVDRANRERERAERGPPPQVTNSRFAAAAADFERESEIRERERNERYDRRRMDGDDRGGGQQFGRDMGPPPVANSRFAAALEADGDYVPAEMRNQRANERNEEDRFGRGGPDGDDRRGDGRGFGGERSGGRFDRGGRYGDNRRDPNEMELPRGPGWKQQAPEEDAFPPLNKGNVSNVLAPKKRDEDVVLAPVEAPITLPGETEEEAKARLEKKKREEEEKAAAEKKAAEEAAAAKEKAEKEAAEQAAKAAAAESTLLDEFISGNKLGDELKQWCADQGSVLPSVEKLIFHLLSEKELKNPDPECGWAEQEKYGSALVSLIDDGALEQMQVLWAIQKYCDTQGFPKINDEYLVQAMFRAMYKHDLVVEDAFIEWKEDESEEHTTGKMNAVIQTTAWFDWLEEDDDDDEDEEYYEEEE